MERFKSSLRNADCIFHASGCGLCFIAAVYAVVSTVLLWTVIAKPSWWLTFLNHIGLVPWWFEVLFVWFVVMGGPVKYFINMKLWKSPIFGEFMPALEEDQIGDAFKNTVTYQINKFRLTRFSRTWWFAHIVVPFIIGELGHHLGAVPNVRRVMWFFVIPDAIREHISNSLHLPFNIAVKVTRFRTEQELRRIKKVVEPNNPDSWHKIGCDYCNLEKALGALWSVAWQSLVHLVVEGVSVAVMLSALGHGTANHWVATIFFSWAISMGLKRIHLLEDLARATASCEMISRTAARQYVTVKMDSDTTIQYMKTMQYLEHTKIGVKIPWVGTINWKLLVWVLRPMAAVVPLVFGAANFGLSKNSVD
jgi:hypothetical protein